MASLSTLVPYTQTPVCLCTALVDKEQGWGTDLHNLWAHRNIQVLIHLCFQAPRSIFNKLARAAEKRVLPPTITSHRSTAHQPSSVCSRLPDTAPLPVQPYCPRTRAGLSPNTARLAGRDETTKDCTQITISSIPAGQYLHSPWHKKL